MSNALTGGAERRGGDHAGGRRSDAHANIHQKGDDGTSPTFIHSVTVRIGDPSKLTSFALAENFLVPELRALRFPTSPRCRPTDCRCCSGT